MTMKMLLAALKRIRGNVRLLVPRNKIKSTASHSVGPNTKDTLWCTQLRTRDGCIERVRNSAFCGRTHASTT